MLKVNRMTLTIEPRDSRFRLTPLIPIKYNKNIGRQTKLLWKLLLDRNTYC